MGFASFHSWLLILHRQFQCHQLRLFHSQAPILVPLEVDQIQESGSAKSRVRYSNKKVHMITTIFHPIPKQPPPTPNQK